MIFSLIFHARSRQLLTTIVGGRKCPTPLPPMDPGGGTSLKKPGQVTIILHKDACMCVWFVRLSKVLRFPTALVPQIQNSCFKRGLQNFHKRWMSTLPHFCKINKLNVGHFYVGKRCWNPQEFSFSLTHIVLDKTNIIMPLWWHLTTKLTSQQSTFGGGG